MDVGGPICGGALKGDATHVDEEKVFGGALALAVPTAGVALGDEPGREIRGDFPRGFTVRLPEGFVPGDHWIGAMCVPVEPALRAQLNLKDREGLVVAQIVPDSPAAKGGLKPFDVVTAINGESIDDLHDLMKAVSDAGEKPIKFDVIRGGKQETVEVTPAKRPELDRLIPNMPAGRRGPDVAELEQMRDHARRIQEQIEQLRDRLPENDIKRMEEWVEQLRRGEHQPLRMQMFGPGVVMRKFAPPPLPAGVSVRVERQADGPTKIHVERGDQTWDVTEKDLDKLPDDLRPSIDAMLAAPPGGVTIAGPNGAAAAAVAGGSAGPGDVKVEIRTDDGRDIVVDPQAVPGANRLNEQVDRLRKEVEALKKKVEELQKLRDAAPAKKPAKDQA
ncbi:MAG: PDZ domain-containing protein [Pirellulales bacterium]